MPRRMLLLQQNWIEGSSLHDLHKKVLSLKSSVKHPNPHILKIDRKKGAANWLCIAPAGLLNAKYILTEPNLKF